MLFLGNIRDESPKIHLFDIKETKWDTESAHDRSKLFLNRGGDSVDFGNRIKELRHKAGITQKQLADQIGVSKSVVSFYERQERTPSPDVLRKLSTVFHVSTDYLLDVDHVRRLDVSGLDDEDIKVISLMVETLRRKNQNNR